MTWTRASMRIILFITWPNQGFEQNNKELEFKTIKLQTSNIIVVQHSAPPPFSSTHKGCTEMKCLFVYAPGLHTQTQTCDQSGVRTNLVISIISQCVVKIQVWGCQYRDVFYVLIIEYLQRKDVKDKNQYGISWLLTTQRKIAQSL